MRIVVPVLLLVMETSVVAQSPQPLVGTWERVSLRGARGAVVQPPAPPATLLMTADGHFSQIAIPVGRPKVEKPLAQMTREELVRRFDNVAARQGIWTVAGDRLTRVDVSSLDPNTEGVSEVRVFRIDGDTLVLTSPDPDNRVEARFRRVVAR